MPIWSKKVGGPKNLAGIATGVGITTIIAKKISNKKNQNNILEVNQEFKVTTAGEDSTGLNFNVDDTFKVVLIDEDIVLIEKIKDENNPYYVSNDFLREISIPYSEYIKKQMPQV